MNTDFEPEVTPSAVGLSFDPIELALERLSVDSVFGAPIQEGGVTIIPIAEVSTVFGYGFGSGETPAGEEGGPAGGGGGARGSARPRGFIRITADGVTYDPTMDPSRTALAGIAMIMWSVFWVALAARSIVQALSSKPTDDCC